MVAAGRKLAIVVLLIAFHSTPAHATCGGNLLTLKVGAATIHAEVAKTEAERGRGLMGRRALPKNWGMWFVMGGESRAEFWMKDTYVELDIIFISRDMNILYIHPNARSMDLTPIASPYPYWYVLEVPAGFAKAHGLSLGMVILNQTPGC